MVKEGYKEVMVGPREIELPTDWEVKKIDNIAEVKGGKRVPKELDLVDEKTPYPYIRVSDFDNFSVNTDNLKYATEEIFNKISRYTISKDDVYISIAGTIGLVGVVPKELDKQLLTENAAKIKIKEKKEVDNKFLAFSLSGFEPQSQIKAFIGTTGVPKLSLGRTKRIILPLPPLPEQKKISIILSSVDKSIEKADEVIEETKALKKGLMQELFTKGIGHSEFKDSQFGKIPKSWEVNVMSYAAEINPRYKIPEKEEYLFLEMDSVNEHSPEVDGYEKREKSRCTNVKFKRGDVLFARITPSTENGKTALIENLEEEIAFGSTELIVLSPKKDLITSEYIYYLLKWSKVRNLSISMMEGSTGRQRVPREVFDSAIKIPLPPLEEQKKIASILSSVDEKIQKEEEYKEKLEKLKKGLMQKLLTGEIRVNIESEV